MAGAGRGFDLATRCAGFGGDRQWNSVTTALEPLLANHPDDGRLRVGTRPMCGHAARLEAIVERRQHDGSDPARNAISLTPADWSSS
ncbi:hypothetical protein ACRAWF_36125 [Streptomyces sp. L7]